MAAPFFCASSRKGMKPSHGDGAGAACIPGIPGICADAARVPTPTALMPTASPKAMPTDHFMACPFTFPKCAPTPGRHKRHAEFGDMAAKLINKGGCDADTRCVKQVNAQLTSPLPAHMPGFVGMIEADKVVAKYDFRRIRLHIEAPLYEGAMVDLNKSQAHYLSTVLRLKSNDRVLVFNGSDGEWEAALEVHRRAAVLHVGAKTRVQTEPTDLHYLFAPLKAARLDYMIQKAVEMGVSRLQPVLTRHGQVARVNASRMRANAIEAAEQCGILTLPEMAQPEALSRVIAEADVGRTLIFCDEDAEVANPLAALGVVPPRSPLSVLIGPEGGFAEDERRALLKLPNVVRLALGPRILRADTAAVAALALVQAMLGDWR